MSSIAFSFGFKDLIDILLVAVILYETYRLLRNTGAANLFWGILLFILMWFLVSYVFQLELTGALFDRIISVGAIALIVIFQEEIRTFFYRVGARFSSWQIFRSHRANEDSKYQQQILEIIQACRHMSSTKTGALIISQGSLIAAACILPVSKNPSIPQEYGLRHRAALGLTEKTDATCIVVSEETGYISIASEGKIRRVAEDELFLELHAGTTPS